MTTAFGPQLSNVSNSPQGTERNLNFDFDTWVRDATGPGTCDGTNLDAAFFNVIIGNIREAVRRSGVELTQGDMTLLFQAIQRIANESGVRDAGNGLGLNDGVVSLAIGTGVLPDVGGATSPNINPALDRIQGFSSVINQPSESSPYNIVRSVLSANGPLGSIQDANSGRITLTFDASQLASADNRIEVGSGLEGGGFLNQDVIDIDLSIGSLPTDGDVDINLDQIAYLDVSDGINKRIDLDTLLGSLVNSAGDDMVGQLRLSDGSTTLPALAFSSDPDLGFSRTAAGQISVIVGGVPVATFDSNGFTTLGTATLVNTTNLAVTDNSIILNGGETGAGVSAGTAGIEIDRGTAASALLRYNEASNTWEIDNGGTTHTLVGDGANVGGGVGVVDSRNGSLLNFKTFEGVGGVIIDTAGAIINVSLDLSSIVPTVVAADIDPLTDGLPILDQSTGGTNIVTVDELLTASGAANDGINEGTGGGVFLDRVGNDLRFRSVLGGRNLNQVENAEDVTLDVDFSLSHTAGPAPHANPSIGDRWFDTTSAILYERITDGTNEIWLDNSSNGNFGSLQELVQRSGDTMDGNLVMSNNALVVTGPGYTAANLPPATPNNIGATAYATALPGGGGTTGLVYSDGVNWRKTRNIVIVA